MQMLNKNFEKVLDSFLMRLPNTLKLRAFGLAKIPLLFLVSPKVIALDNSSCQVLVPLNFITKNHLNSMYFGALAIGADTAVGLLALEVIKEFPDHKLAPIFKSLEAQFLKRAEQNVIFFCEGTEHIRGMINKSIASGERVTDLIKIKAYSEDNPEDVFAEFQLGLSLKAVSK